MTLVNISRSSAVASADREDRLAHQIRDLPVVVISPHNQCNCRCVMCDIWRIRKPQQITPDALERQLTSIRELNVRWMVFSGGEAQLNAHLPVLARMLRDEGIRITLLTAGLLLESEADSIASAFDDVIVSLDGPPPLHNQIRRVAGAFEKVAAGIAALRRARPEIVVSARCTVQKANHHSLCATVDAARQIGLNSISFLAADVSSSAFNRPDGWPPERQEMVALNPAEISVLEAELERLISDHRADMESGFVVENASKLLRIARHFRAHLGEVEHIAPRCNAPWVSAVIEASGDVRPCFFHPAVGNLHSGTLQEIVNGPDALNFRASLDVTTNPICRRCVCSLHLPRQV